MFQDYSAKGVRFFYIYKALAHPELDGYITPVTLDERVMHVREAKRVLGTKIPWLIDTMANDAKHALGDAPNMEFVVDPKGIVVARRAWSDPAALRADLARIVGPSDKVTRPEDTGLATQPRPTHAPTGIVPRLDLPDRRTAFRPVRVEPQLTALKDPFYVKVRAEADRPLIRDGSGRLYLGFHLDPLYGVHWNNLVDPVQYEFTAPPGVTITPAKSAGPKVKEESDADPREFLVEVNRGASTVPARLRFRYYACTDKFCKPVTQEYLVHWDPDRDGGQARPPGPAPAQGRGADPITRFDTDGDGKLTLSEVPPPMKARFADIDTNRDGSLDRSEIQAFRQRRQ